MTTYDTAYCRSLGDSGKYISAEEANELTLKGKISENEELYCSENCPLILTCINRDVDFPSIQIKYDHIMLIEFVINIIAMIVTEGKNL